MKKFVLKLTVIFAPLMLLLAIFFLPIILSLEFLPIEIKTLLYVNGKIELYSQDFDAPTNSLYIQGQQLKNSDADVIAFGSSRNMPFSKLAFTDGDEFINISVSRTSANYINGYINSIENILKYSTPEIIMIDLNQFEFNENFLNEVGLDISSSENYDIFEYSDDEVMPYLINYYNNFVEGKIAYLNILENAFKPRIGLSAYSNNSGMTLNGPYYYGSVYNKYDNDREQFNNRHQDVLGLINNNSGAYAVFDEPYQGSIDVINELTEYCHEKGIHLIAILPSVGESVMQEIKNPNGSLVGMGKIYDAIYPYFERYDFELYDYTDASYLGVDDEYFIDMMHTSDVAYTIQLKDMLLKGSKLNDYTTIEHLDMLIKQAYSPLHLEKIN